MKYTLTGSCPKCGAPVYETRKNPSDPTQFDGLASSEPSAYFTCECRLTLPAALPDVDGDALETTAQADRKHQARARAEAGEPDSEERVDDRH